MEEDSLQAFRETRRNLLFHNRRRQKDEETDVRRSLVNSRLNPSDILITANKLKTKAPISASELKLLQNALVDDVTNVDVVMNIHGALRGLVRELSGHDVNKQSAACGCICNLALGDSKTCLTIAKAAGAYLVATLDTLTTQLATSSAWTLGNLGGSGDRVCDVIVAQGALAKLCDVTCRGGDVTPAAVYALTHLAFVMKDDLRTEHLHKILQSISATELNMDTSHLLFILSCHKDFTAELIPQTYLQRIVQNLTVSMENHINICRRNNTQNQLSKVNQDISKSGQESVRNGQEISNTHLDYAKTDSGTKCCDLVYLLRVLANLNSAKVYSDLVDYFVSSNLVANIKWMLEMDADESLLWLLGNIFNCCGDGAFFEKLLM